MLREETAKLLMMIQGAYPNYKPDNKTVTKDILRIHQRQELLPETFR